MKKQLLILVTFCLSANYCVPKNKKNPNLPDRSNELPRFIRFDDTEAVLRLRRVVEWDNEEEDRHNRELLDHLTQYITSHERAIPCYNSFWFALWRPFHPIQYELLRSRLFEQRDTAVEHRSRLIAHMIGQSPYDSRRVRFFDVPSSRSFPSENVQKIPLKDVLKEYSKDVLSRE